VKHHGVVVASLTRSGTGFPNALRRITGAATGDAYWRNLPRSGRDSRAHSAPAPAPGSHLFPAL